MGYAKKYHVERLFREMMIPYLAPVSQQLVLSYIAEKALGLPKSIKKVLFSTFSKLITLVIVNVII